MKRASTLLLRLAVIIIGLGPLVLLVYGLPLVIKSGVTGGYLPILLGLYVPAIPFFLALYQAWKLLNYIDQNQIFSSPPLKAFQKIKYYGYIICGLFVAGMPYIFIVAERDDAPGVIAITLVIIFSSFVIGTFAGVLQALIKNALDIKSENDLTV